MMADKGKVTCLICERGSLKDLEDKQYHNRDFSTKGNNNFSGNRKHK